MYSKAARMAAQELGLSQGKANLEAFAATLQELAEEDPSIIAVVSDSRGSGKLKPFGQARVKQIVEMGIAEQNLVGVAAGLASTGRKTFAVSPACFLTARSLEQIKNDICYSDNPVTLIGISAGVSYGALGSTHHSLHDFAALRAINNIDIVVPADNFETDAAIRYGANAAHPVYIRFGKLPLYDLPARDQPFARGQARLLREGTDLAILATGEAVPHALFAGHILARDHGLSCRVLSLPFVKPLDEEAVCAAARECRALLTVEEHMIHGGLGEACASLLMHNGISLPFKAVAIPDEYTVTGSQADIFFHYGMTAEGLAGTARELINQAES
jgi:transketolase